MTDEPALAVPHPEVLTTREPSTSVDTFAGKVHIKWAPEGAVRGAEDIRRCPFQIGIVSTGLIVQGTVESRTLLECRFGTLVLDEAHRARRSRGITGTDSIPIG